MSAALPPVLLLHGWGGSHASTFAATGWHEALRGRRILVRDLPGHGAGGSDDPAAYADLTGQIRAALPSSPVDIVGYSLGAKLALALASACPSRVRRLALGGVGDNIFAPEPDGEHIARLLDGSAEDGMPPDARAIADYALANGNEAGAMAALLRRPVNPVITDDGLPDGRSVLLVNSDADTIAMPDDRLRAAMPQARYVRLSGIPHLALPGDERFREEAATFLTLA